MNIINFFIENWYVFIIALALIEVILYVAYVFFKMPKNAQIAKVKEWLLWAVAEAEKELGSGTGQLKLRYVYDMFIERFPALAKLITFEAFSLMVDDVLVKFKKIISTNPNAENYINTNMEVK